MRAKKWIIEIQQYRGGSVDWRLLKPVYAIIPWLGYKEVDEGEVTPTIRDDGTPNRTTDRAIDYALRQVPVTAEYKTKVL